QHLPRRRDLLVHVDRGGLASRDDEHGKRGKNRFNKAHASPPFADAGLPPAYRQGCQPSSRRLAMTCAWISAAPSKIDRMRASHNTRLTGYSSAKPLPPWIWSALSAAAQAARAASSLAMPASRSQRRPASFSRAAKYVSWRASR